MYNFKLNIISLLSGLERISFYGLRSFLILYLVKILNIEDVRAQELFGGYAVLSYLTTILGGYVADHYLGAKRTILLGATAILAGHIFLFIDSLNINNVILSLSAISLGTGLFKPNTLTMISELFKNDAQAKTKGFRFYHTFFNACVAPTPIICGYLFDIKPEYAFLCAGLAMLLSYIVIYIYWDDLDDTEEQLIISDKNYYTGIIGALVVVLIYLQHLILLDWSLFNTIYLIFGILLSIYIGYILYHSTTQEQYNIIYIIYIMLILLTSITFTSQATKVFILLVDRHADLNLGSFYFHPTYLESIDPLTVLILGSLLTYFSKNESLENISTKVILIFTTISASFMVMYLALTQTYDINYNVSVIYPIFSVFLLISTEVIMYPFALATTTTLAPKKYSGFFAGFVCYALSLARYGSIIVSKIAAIPDNIATGGLESLNIYSSYLMQMSISTLVVLAVLLLILQIPIFKPSSDQIKSSN